MASEDLSFDDLWTRYIGADVTTAEWAAPGWNMARILGDLRAEGLTGPEMMDIANAIAAGLEERGLGPTAPAASIETLTLTTAHAASSYGVPVLLLDGGATPYGPADMTPAGVTGAELVATWAERFYGPAWSSYLRRRSGETAERTARS